MKRFFGKLTRWLSAAAWACAATAVAAGAQAAEQVSLSVPLIITPGENAVLGGSDNATSILHPNIALLQRLVLEPQDLHKASATVSLEPAAGGAEQAVIVGKRGQGTAIQLADVPELQAVELEAGQGLVISIWRSQFHFFGGGELSNLRIERVDGPPGGESAELPQFRDSPQAQTPLGTFELAGFTKRDNFPKIEKQIAVSRGDDAGVWVVEDARGVNLTSSAGALRFHTNGKANTSGEYDAAPALVFRPTEAGTYRLAGTLNLTSGKPADASDPATMRWMVMHAPGDAGSAPADLKVYRAIRRLADTASPTAGADYDPAPLATIPLDRIQAGNRESVEIKDLAPVLREWIANPSEAHGLVLAVEPRQGVDGAAPRIVLRSQDMSGEITLTSHPKHALFENPLRPREGVFASLHEGKLHYGGERLRLWGVVGYPNPDRLVNMGFNAQRVWAPVTLPCPLPQPRPRRRGRERGPLLLRHVLPAELGLELPPGAGRGQQLRHVLLGPGVDAQPTALGLYPRQLDR